MTGIKVIWERLRDYLQNTNVSAISPVSLVTTIAVFQGQTLTCNIGDLTQVVEVFWKDYNGTDITEGIGGYAITNGTIDGSDVQISTLTIADGTLETLVESSTLTWKCAAKSTLYPDSEKSSYSDVVVNFLVFGKLIDPPALICTEINKCILMIDENTTDLTLIRRLHLQKFVNPKNHLIILSYLIN